MTIRINHSALPLPQGRPSPAPSADATFHDANPSLIAPQLVPLLDLLADLIARALVEERRDAEVCRKSEVSEAHVMVDKPGAPAMPEKHGKCRSVSQIPSNVPPRVPRKSHLSRIGQ